MSKWWEKPWFCRTKFQIVINISRNKYFETSADYIFEFSTSFPDLTGGNIACFIQYLAETVVFLAKRPVFDL